MRMNESINRERMNESINRERMNELVNKVIDELDKYVGKQPLPLGERFDLAEPILAAAMRADEAMRAAASAVADRLREILANKADDKPVIKITVNGEDRSELLVDYPELLDALLDAATHNSLFGEIDEATGPMYQAMHSASNLINGMSQHLSILEHMSANPTTL
jgi:hypothetical protein